MNFHRALFEPFFGRLVALSYRSIKPMAISWSHVLFPPEFWSEYFKISDAICFLLHWKIWNFKLSLTLLFTFSNRNPMGTLIRKFQESWCKWVVSQLISLVVQFYQRWFSMEFFISYGLFGFLWQKIVLQKSQSIWNNWTTSEMSSETIHMTRRPTFNKRCFWKFWFLEYFIF